MAQPAALTRREADELVVTASQDYLDLRYEQKDEELGWWATGEQLWKLIEMDNRPLLAPPKVMDFSRFDREQGRTWCLEAATKLLNERGLVTREDSKTRLAQAIGRAMVKAGMKIESGEYPPFKYRPEAHPQHSDSVGDRKSVV